MKLLSLGEDDGGFTLLEMLIATMVISMIILSSHTLLEQLMVTGKKQTRYNRITAELIRSRTLFERDLQEIMIDKEHPLIVRRRHDNCSDDIVFYTHNISNPDNTMGASLLRVNWSLNEGRLNRQMIDGDASEASSVTISQGVKCMTLRQYHGGAWGGIPGIQLKRPKGIAIKIMFESNLSIEAIIPE